MSVIGTMHVPDVAEIIIAMGDLASMDCVFAWIGYLHLLDGLTFSCGVCLRRGRQVAFPPCIFYQIILPGRSLIGTYTDRLRGWDAGMRDN